MAQPSVVLAGGPSIASRGKAALGGTVSILLPKKKHMEGEKALT